MPRLAPSIVRYASGQNKHLATLLGQCRTLESANNELRWLREHVAKERTRSSDGSAPLKPPTLERLVKRRARGEPLQYIIGDQPFGGLEILCRPNVLIPRLETEIYTTAVVKALGGMRLFQHATENLFSWKSLRILDLCSGSGCIGLLLHNLLHMHLASDWTQPTGSDLPNSPYSIQILGIDLSLDAIRLSQKNLMHNVAIGALHPSAADEVKFRIADITALARRDKEIKKDLAELISPSVTGHEEEWDILISNPPYVSPKDYAVGGRTERSVRNFEPRMALVPREQRGTSVDQADLFYPPILRIARQTGVKLTVMEIGDEAQASRVRNLVRAAGLNNDGDLQLETWYDDGKLIMHPTEGGTPRRELGRSNDTGARAVVVWRGQWARRRALMKLNRPARAAY